MAHIPTGEGASINLDTDIRVKAAEDLLCQQYTGKQIVRTLCEMFGVVERTAYHYLKIAYERLQADAADDRAIRKVRARATWQTQYRKCLAAKDYSAANYALDRLCKLDGLFAPQKHKVEMTGAITVGVSVRHVMNALDAQGLAAMEIVLAQLEAARQRGELPDEPVPTPPQLPEGISADDIIDADEPKPMPVKTRNRKGRTRS